MTVISPARVYTPIMHRLCTTCRRWLMKIYLKSVSNRLEAIKFLSNGWMVCFGSSVVTKCSNSARLKPGTFLILISFGVDRPKVQKKGQKRKYSLCRASPECRLCGHSNQTPEHFLVECPLVWQVWTMAMHMWIPHWRAQPSTILRAFYALALPPSPPHIDSYHVLDGVLAAVWKAYWHTIFDDVPFVPANGDDVSRWETTFSSRRRHFDFTGPQIVTCFPASNNYIWSLRIHTYHNKDTLMQDKIMALAKCKSIIRANVQ
ncbi:hypothetical protein PHYBLDRAFT_174542 [Phycomyces blakesleeanus NRRL 1555(-)]|uniref:Reverse transcriptase zinc-binding domain-containing protein n=1 Tax=Phycomyces blakesleeanus (strain ATCC 8743b / DSM 1359 / FGSC 10004 / NBRC 33097 / NRRL 1555) TaxID=763407 RepID=A0A167K2W2_PHYB8|nr:hypothetical protein PHYBLDRAFT_174542 [Phycomyces blakesleeanus NRRL 1555(-)]OAD67157.1 hypothetical protein PHYBLDRAFT_174542 [Phycomyces blakesleeanus NRRL 1555(-)]|eukprot:XP_018285197.1 hypothetical protein PHYBLDRAFT_174542 [Phycomyces blakesleeanus NRRL 1555(-)]